MMGRYSKLGYTRFNLGGVSNVQKENNKYKGLITTKLENSLSIGDGISVQNEDTKYTIEDIKREFGDVVVSLVMGASEPDKSLSWEERKAHTIEETKNYL